MSPVVGFYYTQVHSPAASYILVKGENNLIQDRNRIVYNFLEVGSASKIRYINIPEIFAKLTLEANSKRKPMNHGTYYL